MGARDVSNFQMRADGAAFVLLDPATVRVLVDQARTSRKSPAILAAKLLQDALDDAADVRDARRTLARIKSGEEKTTPWRKVKADLGL